MAAKSRPVDKRPAMRIDAKEMRDAILQNSAARRSTQQATKVTVNINQPRGEGGAKTPKAKTPERKSRQPVPEGAKAKIQAQAKTIKELREQGSRAQKSADSWRKDSKYWLKEAQSRGGELRRLREKGQPIPPDMSEALRQAEAKAASAEAKATRFEQMANQYSERMQTANEDSIGADERSSQRERELRERMRRGGHEVAREIARRDRQLSEAQEELAQLRRERAQGGGNPDADARIRALEGNINALIIRGGGGGAAAAAAAAGGNAAMIEHLGGMGVHLSEAQLQQILEAIGGQRGGGEAAENQLMQKVRAWQLAGVRTDDMKKLLFKESGIEEEKKKSGSAKFAENTENVSRGVGSMANVFNPAMFGNILLIVVLVLMIWIVINMFKFV